ncbi:lipase family protein [Roseateles sp.]|uniref:lipase family protein n=1 Tax=Roseateles sp. TaxID=1971397 RepID=UPI0039E8CFE1
MTPYSSTAADLFFPEQRAPVFTSQVTNKDRAVAIEAARLSYYRFEDALHGQQNRLALEAGLAHAGFRQFEYFEATVPGMEVLMLPDQPFHLPESIASTLPRIDALDDLLQPFGHSLKSLAEQAATTALNLPGTASSVLHRTLDRVVPGLRLFRNPTGTQAFAALRDDNLGILVFRGSQADTLVDALIDGQFLQVRADGWTGDLHHGFARAATAIWPKVDAWLRRNPDADLLLCGHSLGAAVATLVAVRAGRPGRTQLVTIGSPRVGNMAFAEAFAGAGIDAVRIVDNSDVVATVPPKGVPHLDYVHVGQVVEFIDSQGVQGGASPAADRNTPSPTLLQLATQLRAGVFLPLMLTDHACVNYLRAYWP